MAALSQREGPVLDSPIFTQVKPAKITTDSKTTASWEITGLGRSEEEALPPRRNLPKENALLRTQNEQLKSTISEQQTTINRLRARLLPHTEAASKEDIASPIVEELINVLETMQKIKGSWEHLFNAIQGLNKELDPFVIDPESKFALGGFGARYNNRYKEYRIFQYINQKVLDTCQTTLTKAKTFSTAVQAAQLSPLLTAVSTINMLPLSKMKSTQVSYEKQIAHCEIELQAIIETRGKAVAEFTKASSTLYTCYDTQNPINWAFGLVRSNPYAFSASAVATAAEVECETLE